jgi:large subunit ribosomal protein L6
MSRIGRLPVVLPSGVEVTMEGATVRVSAGKQALTMTVPAGVSVRHEDQRLLVEAEGAGASGRAMHGLARALIANMVQGLTNGFSKELDIVGVGYRAQLSGARLSLHVGFSHPVEVPIPEGITIQVPKPTTILIKGADKQQVGQFAATLRRIAPPEPYKGKGIKYAGEVIRRKAGKAATGSGAKASA